MRPTAFITSRREYLRTRSMMAGIEASRPRVRWDPAQRPIKSRAETPRASARGRLVLAPLRDPRVPAPRFFFVMIESRHSPVGRAVTKQSQVLVIGAIGSSDWIHSSHGRKIEKAVKYRSAGIPLSIVSEEHWQRFVGIK